MMIMSAADGQCGVEVRQWEVIRGVMDDWSLEKMHNGFCLLSDASVCFIRDYLRLQVPPGQLGKPCTSSPQ